MQKSIIEEIFWDNQGYVEKIQPSEEYKKISDKGYEFYCKLMEMLNEEQQKILGDFADSRLDEVAEASITHFKEGVKVGLRLGLECLY